MFIQRSQPVAEQVLALLRQRIRDKEYGLENRLPSESELASELHVSRATVRSALSALAAEKLIVRRQGDGTYINRRFVETTTHFGAISEFTSMILSSGHKPSIRGLKVTTRKATSCEAEALEIPAGSNVIMLVRLFFSDEKPAIYSVNAIPADLLCQTLSLQDIEEPLPDFFKKLCFQEFTYGISDLRATNAPPDIAEYLQIPTGMPLVYMAEVFYNDQDQALVYAVNYFNEKVFKLKVARSFD